MMHLHVLCSFRETETHLIFDAVNDLCCLSQIYKGEKKIYTVSTPDTARQNIIKLIIINDAGCGSAQCDTTNPRQ